MTSTGIATGKIILAGEYAMAFGYPGIAIPSHETMRVRFRPASGGGLTVVFQRDDFHPEWAMYAGRVAEILMHTTAKHLCGRLSVDTDLPLGKGMGSSTALVIAIARCLLGSRWREGALMAEDAVNPGHSGMDFAVIAEGKPILFQRGKQPKPVTLPRSLIAKITLLDSGTPNEQTPELVAWVRSREAGLKAPLAVIGGCAERLLAGEDPRTVIREHHRAQVALGVVPPHAQAMIAAIDKEGRAAKVIGAGGRSGGGGMILSFS